ASIWRDRRIGQGVEFDPLASSAALVPLLVAGAVDEDAAHSLGRGGEEVAPAAPLLRLAAADQAEVGFMDERGRLECLPRLLVGQACGGELPQLVVHER